MLLSKLMEDQVIPNREGRIRLLDEAKNSSTEPGVYLMRDPAGVILYIGKAKNLKNRLTSYFIRAPHETPRTEMMVGRAERFDVILTKTESEALILECTLIKKHKPKFNIRLKDDKTYPYLKIQVDAAFPRIEWTRKVRRDEARYFGPFPSAWSARQIKELLNETFKLRDCSDNTFRHRSRPCILYQMSKCTAPCVGYISEEDYRATLREVVQVLEGKSNRLEGELLTRMQLAAEEERFEDAAYFRDQIAHLKVVTAVQAVDEAGSHRNRDVIALERQGADAQAVVLRVRGGRMVSVKHVHLQNSDESQPESEVLMEFISQFYLSLRSELDQKSEDGVFAGENYPNEILLPELPKDFELLEKTLELKIRVPETEMEKQLVNVAKTNVRHSLEQSQKAGVGHGIAALEEIQNKLHLNQLPSRIECYDISNIQGEDAVASRVVFVDGAPDKNLYRRYKIKTVVGSNDFAMMKEVLGRRFANVEEALPDLVVVDGGKGQLSQAVAILEELSVQGVGVVGLAKARTESDFKSSEVTSSSERIFIPGRKNPVNLLPHTKAYRLLTHIRDEAHRFAIQYHRHLRDKRILASGKT
jgi:excinuclease ABC subunit C